MLRRGLWSITSMLVPVMLIGCGQQQQADRNLDSLDAELADGNLTGNARDPALMSALQDQIMVDPALTASANNDAIRPPAQPYSAPVPANTQNQANVAPVAQTTSQSIQSAPPPVTGADCPQCVARQQSMTLGALAARQRNRGAQACSANVQYSTRWALRLPSEFPLYPDARLIEAAGNETSGCALRIASFATSASLQTVIDWYYTKARAAGYSGEHQADGKRHVLAGTRGDAAYALFVVSRSDGGADVDLVASNGR